MITTQNFTNVIANLETHELVDAIDAPEDNITLRVNIFNAGWTSEIESTDSIDFEAIEDGNLSLDKDAFIAMLKEHNAFPAVLEGEY